jgi:hypothetical protein
MTETIENLESKIRAIRESSEYVSLVTKHRGPMDDRRLTELNMRINTYETQKRELTPPIIKSNKKAAVRVVVKPKPKPIHGTFGGGPLSNKVVQKPIIHNNDITKPKLPASMKKAMPPEPEPLPEAKTSGNFTTLGKMGRHAKLAMKPKSTTKEGLSLSKPTSSLIKPEKIKPKKEEILEDLDDITYYNVDEDNIFEDESLDDLDEEPLYS